MEIKLSVIIPTFNEDRAGIFPKALDSFKELEGVEILVSDGGSSDSTLAIASEAGAVVIASDPNSRAQRINDGVAAAKGKMVLLNHPRSALQPEGVRELIKMVESNIWGGFTHSFDHPHPLLKFTSWYSNQVRARFGRIVYLDHCKFAPLSLLKKVGPLPPVDIFEDTLLSKKLSNAAGAPVILPYKSVTSAARFVERGIFRQGLLNQWLKLQFLVGGDHRRMNRFYEGDNGLNSSYSRGED